MNHLNSVLLEGKITSAPRKINLSNSDYSLVKLEITSERSYRGKDGKNAIETTAIPIQCWSQLGDKVLDKLKAGMTVRVVGRLRQAKWVSSRTGSSHTSIEIVAEHIEFRNSENGTAVITEEEKQND